MGITTVCSHPDGHEITVSNGLLTTMTADGDAVSIPIDSAGLAALGEALLERAALDAQDESEKEGAELGLDLLDEMLELHGRPQAESFNALRYALLELLKAECPESACGGFAGAVVNVLEIGITNLAEGELE